MRSLERCLASKETLSMAEQLQQEVTAATFRVSPGGVTSVPSVGDVSEDPILGY